MAAFSVATLLAIPACGVEGSIEILLGDLFHIRIDRQCILIEALAEKGHQSRTIRDEPGLHALNHEVGVFICRLRRPGPVVLILQMQPGRFLVVRCHWRLAVHQQGDEVIISSLLQCDAKILVCSLTATAGHDARHPAFETGLAEEFAETLATFCFQGICIAASLDVDLDLHQRLPPSSPLRQSSPRL